MRRLSTAVTGLVCGALIFAHHAPRLSAQSSTALSINGSQQFQVIDGFGVSANSASWNNGQLRPAIDLLVDQLGATIWRVIIDNGDWEATNDNGDPNTFNWTYYNGVYTSPKLEELWSTIAYLNQKGVTDRLVLNFMGPVATWMGGARINTTAEDEWVEMVASLVYYAKVTRGLQFGMLSPINEPNWDGIEGPMTDQFQYTRLLRKLSLKLDAIGLSSVRFVGPETAQVTTGVQEFMPVMMGDSVVMGKVDHFAFHNYNGDAGGADAAIKSSAYPSRNFWISEVSNIWDMLAHLSQGPSAILTWDAYDSVYNHAILAGRGTSPPNDVGNGPALLAYNSSTQTYSPRKAFYEQAQLFKFVPPGARRIAATESNSNLTVYAFRDQSSGRVTIVGRNASTSGFTLTGTLTNVPSISQFELYQTTPSSNMQRGADVTVTNGAFSAQIAGSSVFTLTTTTSPSSGTLPAAPTGLRILTSN